jgi:DNA-binding response OmpR family regulator
MMLDGEQIRVLVVDDSPELLEMLVSSLTHAGKFVVQGVRDGIAGLEAVFEFRPHCVVVDVKRPGLDGYRLVRAMRSDAETATIPLIILSTMAQQERIAGYVAGVDRTLLKPAKPQDIVTAIREVLAISEDERRQRLLAERGEPPSDGAGE